MTKITTLTLKAEGEQADSLVVGLRAMPQLIKLDLSNTNLTSEHLIASYRSRRTFGRSACTPVQSSPGSRFWPTHHRR
jgi:hypothetical protein